jgi:hypothetical protein
VPAFSRNRNPQEFTDQLHFEIGTFAYTQTILCVRLAGRIPTYLASLGWAYAKAGRTDDTKTILAELRDLVQKAHISPYFLAPICLELREMDQCFDCIEKAIEEGGSMVFMLGIPKVPMRFATNVSSRGWKRLKTFEMGFLMKPLRQ